MTEVEFQTLYERYAVLIHQRCCALLGNGAEAQEATQEVFLRAFRRMPEAIGPYRLAWLYTTAANLCRDRARSQKRAQRYALQRDELPTADSGNVTEHRATIRFALAKLDSVTSEIGILHFLDGFTQEEIGDRTGYSRKTVAKKLAHFREAVLSTLREDPTP